MQNPISQTRKNTLIPNNIRIAMKSEERFKSYPRNQFEARRS